MQPCYIFDLDGTLADLSHRIHHIQKKPKDWKAFFDATAGDAPIKHIIDLAKMLKQRVTDSVQPHLVPRVVFMSGRPESTRLATEDWLAAQQLGGIRLYMRTTGDFRDDSIVKSELLQQLRADRYEPIMAFDDRDRVVKMWRENGIPCAQVAPGDF